MNDINRKICEIVQNDGRISTSAIAQTLGIPVSTANDRLRRLEAGGVIVGWRGVLAPDRVGAAVCAFLLIDMRYEGEAEAVDALRSCPEVLELHHVSGAHSYLAKIRVGSLAAVQTFLTEVLKPLTAVTHTETIFSLQAIKEISSVKIGGSEEIGLS